MIRIKPSHPLYPIIDGLQMMLCYTDNPSMAIGCPDIVERLKWIRECAKDYKQYLAELEELFDMVEGMNG
jgi:hypothetical protein